MRWSFRLATLAGTEIRIHLTFLLLVAWYAWVAWQGGGGPAAQAAVVFVLLVFACILAHEFGHVLMARRYGIRTPDILLSPIGGLARLERMPEEPMQELRVALAGPAVTLVLIGLFWAGIALTGGFRPGGLLQFDPARRDLALALFQVNVVLLLFNLIPAFPMDGGRVLRALLSTRTGAVRGTRIAARIGQGFALLLGLVGLWGSPFLILIAGFIYLAADAEYRAVETRAAGRGIHAVQMMATDIRTLRVYATLDDAVQLLLAGEQREFPVVDNNGRLEGLLTRDDLVRGLSSHGGGATVDQVMTRGVQPLLPGDPFDRALERLRLANLSALPVVNPDGTVVGMVTADNITDLLLVRRHRG